MKMPPRRALVALGVALAAAAGVAVWQSAGGSGGTPLQQGAAPMPSRERVDALDAALVAELRVSTGEMAGERVSVVPTTWQAVDRFVMGRRFARGCRARIVRRSTAAPSLEPVYSVVFKGAGLAGNFGSGPLHPDSPTPEQLRVRYCLPERGLRATVGVIDAPTNQVIGAYWVNEMPDLSPLGPVIEYTVR